MIEIQLYPAIALYAAVLSGIIVIIWVYTEITVRRSHRFWANQYLWRCVFCGYRYLDDRSESVSECPRCGSYNAPADRAGKTVEPGVSTRDRTKTDKTVAAGQHNPSRRRRPHQRRRGPRRHR